MSVSDEEKRVIARISGANGDGVDISAGANVLGGGSPYTASDVDSRMMVGWSPSLQSADDSFVPHRDLSVARSRDLARNDAYVRAAQALYADGIVGARYTLMSDPAMRALGPEFDEDWKTEFTREVEAKFALWAESPKNWPDASRIQSFTELVRLAVSTTLVSGEFLGTVEWIREMDRPSRTAIQAIDPDRLRTPPSMTGLVNRRITAGIETDARGKPTTYFIMDRHPNAALSVDRVNLAPDSFRAVRSQKPWGRPQVIHIYNPDRPDQSRGEPAMMSAIRESRITQKFRDMSLQNAIVRASMVAAVESDQPPSEIFAALGGVEDVSATMGEYTQAYLERMAEYQKGAKNLTLDGVKIPHLFPGTKLNLNQPGDGGPLGQEFEESLLRYIASSLGVSYEQLSRDYRHTSYSSARAAMAETWKHLQAWKRTVADKFANIVYRLWLEEAINSGMIESLPPAARRPGWLYEGMNFDAISRASWVGAARGQIDELKETQAALNRVKGGLSSIQAESARLGLDWRDVFDQRAREIERQQEIEERLGRPLFTGEDASAAMEMMAMDSEDGGEDDAGQ